MKQALYCLLLSVLAMSLQAYGQNAAKLQDLLANAKSGQTVELPAGEITGGATLPEGVSLKGAGYGKTIINAKGMPNGIVVKGGSGVSISDLAVHGADGADILVQGAEKATVARVRATGSLIGVSMSQCKASRMENVISDNNRYGVVVVGGEGNCVVNCSIVGNATIGLSLPSGKGIVAFNNVVTDSATAVLVGTQAQNVTLDHNLYLGFGLGKFHDQLPRNTMTGWRSVSNLDAHSVSIPVKYEDAANAKYKVTNVIDWALDRAVTSGWGAASLGGQNAPQSDIDGVKQLATPDLGAFVSTAKAPRQPDGKFTVSSGEGVSSAGIFDKQGRLVTYLFQGLPLAKGDYSFYLPSRSYKGTNIATGDYELRLLESNLQWKYMGVIGNANTPDEPLASIPAEPCAVGFDDAGHVFAGRNISEEHVNVRGYDLASGKWLWLLNGNASVFGLHVAKDGFLYALRPEGGEVRLTRMRCDTGAVAPWGKTDYGSTILKNAKGYTGFTPLGEDIFFADTANNALQVGTLASPEPTRKINVASPTCPVGDTKANVVWVISGGSKIVAISPDGKIVAESQTVARPVALAARDGRLAVASAQTGKIHFFDASNPAKLVEQATFGRGDSPEGELLPDRFLFKNNMVPVAIALGPKGELGVAEIEGRMQVFDADRKVIWSTVGMYGAGSTPSNLTTGRVFGGNFAFRMDSEKGTWKPELYYPFSSMGRFYGDFKVNGKTFMMFQAYTNTTCHVNFAEVLPDKLKLVGALVGGRDNTGTWTLRYDDNKDGVIDEKDTVVSTLTDASGKPVMGPLFDPRFTYANADGEITTRGGAGAWISKWKCGGLDGHGAPIYRYADRVEFKGAKDGVVSPYKTHIATGPGSADHMKRPGGGYVCLGACNGCPWRVLINNGGADLIGVNKDGVVDWINPFGTINVIGSLRAADGLYLAAICDSYDVFPVNDDGLMCNGFGPHEQANFPGHWVDDPCQLQCFVDAQGKVNVLVCDYVTHPCNPWYRLEKKDMRSSKFAVKVDADLAAKLAAQPTVELNVDAGKPATPILRIPHLKAPMTIDGGMQKWRDRGIEPQVLITPDCSLGIKGPRDGSAVIRMAWEGQNLYMQVLKFDNVITTHQATYRAYLQDTVEVNFNSIMEGVKWNMSMTTDKGPVNQVDGLQMKCHILDQKDSPLVIKILDDAQSVTERKLIENIYGVDMSKCKVELFETKVPMNNNTYAGKENAKLDLKTGAKFWIGFMLDDNDNPGTDLQNLMGWPATYGTWAPKEQMAQAILE